MGASKPWDWRATTKLNADGTGKIYLHIFRWPADGKFTLTATCKPFQITKACLLADPRTVVETRVAREEERTTLTRNLPAQAPDPIASVVVLDVKP